MGIGDISCLFLDTLVENGLSQLLLSVDDGEDFSTVRDIFEYKKYFYRFIIIKLFKL